MGRVKMRLTFQGKNTRLQEGDRVILDGNRGTLAISRNGVYLEFNGKPEHLIGKLDHIGQMRTVLMAIAAIEGFAVVPIDQHNIEKNTAIFILDPPE